MQTQILEVTENELQKERKWKIDFVEWVKFNFSSWVFLYSRMTNDSSINDKNNNIKSVLKSWKSSSHKSALLQMLSYLI